MNFIEAMKEAKKGKKIKNSKWADAYIQIINGDIVDENYNSYLLTFHNISDIEDKWEVYKESAFKKEQTQLDAIKYKLIKNCNEKDSCSECFLSEYDFCFNNRVPNKLMLNDWNKKEIIDAYKILKEGE